MAEVSVLFWYFAGTGFLVHILQITKWGMTDVLRFIRFYRRWRAEIWRDKH